MSLLNTRVPVRDDRKVRVRLRRRGRDHRSMPSRTCTTQQTPAATSNAPMTAATTLTGPPARRSPCPNTCQTISRGFLRPCTRPCWHKCCLRSQAASRDGQAPCSVPGSLQAHGPCQPESAGFPLLLWLPREPVFVCFTQHPDGVDHAGHDDESANYVGFQFGHFASSRAISRAT